MDNRRYGADLRLSARLTALYFNTENQRGFVDNPTPGLEIPAPILDIPARPGKRAGAVATPGPRLCTVIRRVANG